MGLVPACYTSGRGISLNRALFQLRLLHYRERSFFSILLIMASNLGVAKSIASCEATDPGKYVTYKNIF